MSNIQNEPILRKLTRSKSMGTILFDIEKHDKILGYEDLKYLMYNLKNFYNSIQIIKTDNNRNINWQKFQERKLDYLIKDIPMNEKEFQEDNEKLFYSKGTSEIMKIRYENLKKQKMEISKKLDEEIEYFNILKNQLKNERENMIYYNDLEVQINEKLKRIGVSISTLDKNQSENFIKSRNIHKMNEDINQKIKTMNSLIYVQTSKCQELSRGLQQQKEILIKEKGILKEKNNTLEKTIIAKKNEYKELFRTVEKSKNTKIEIENRVIRTVLGLDLIKR